MSDGFPKMTERRLEQLTGRSHWRSLEEWQELQDNAAPNPSPEFPAGSELSPRIERRALLQLIAANAALAGVTGCGVTRNPRPILPYVREPADVVIGSPRYYATSQVLDGHAVGLLVETHEGRPTKIEGNPEHPASLGATGPLQQASIMQLYDQDRGNGVLREGGEPFTGNGVRRLLAKESGALGRRLRIIIEPTSSPTLKRLLGAVRDSYPDCKVTFHSVASQRHAQRGAKLAFGEPLLPLCDFTKPKIIASFDADFLGTGPLWLRYARQWAEHRRLRRPDDTMSRLYVAEPMLSVTGSMADARLPLPASHVPGLMAALAKQLFAGAGGAAPELRAALGALPAAPDSPWLRHLLADLRRHGADSLVVVGERQPPAVHALAHGINARLGALGESVQLVPSVQLELGDAQQDLAQLVAEMRSGAVDSVLLLGVNPSYTAPAELEFSEALRQVPFSLCLSLYWNETARNCKLYVPQTHFLEAWGDARAYDGTLGVVQPVIEPLYDAWSEITLLSLVLNQADTTDRQQVRASFPDLNETEFATMLQRGLLAHSHATPASPPIAWHGVAVAAHQSALLPVSAEPLLEVNFALDPKTYDGRFANNTWLQELAHPITKICWDNAAYISPQTAAQLDLHNEQLVRVSLAGRSMDIAIWIVPGHANGTLTLPLGYGRSSIEARVRSLGEQIAHAVGFDAYQLRTSATLQIGLGAVIEPLSQATNVAEHTGQSEADRFGLGPVAGENARYPIATTQRHWQMQGRPIAMSTTLEEYRKDPHFTRQHKGPVLSLLKQVVYEGPQWAMSIDLSVCTSCSSCVTACFAENNLMMVGKAGVRASREMHWLRIDTYYSGSPEQPKLVHQPMLCQHCEEAPCEYVCPVNATVHSPDGLNEMIYNRCIGTRFCSNNCPYKVRRFNWFDWGERAQALDANPLLDMQRNPEVSVRERGVMEKCTYCVQRVRTTEIQAKVEGVAFSAASIQTACQQACPTRAIEFGSLGDASSAMVKYREQPRSYQVLHDQGTQPRTMYLARVDNPPTDAGDKT